MTKNNYFRFKIDSRRPHFIFNLSMKAILIDLVACDGVCNEFAVPALYEYFEIIEKMT